jgi:hypothetical protein
VPGSLGDPFRVIESLPGVSQVVWPLAIYAIRGANPGNTGFFVGRRARAGAVSLLSRPVGDPPLLSPAGGLLPGRLSGAVRPLRIGHRQRAQPDAAHRSAARVRRRAPLRLGRHRGHALGQRQGHAGGGGPPVLHGPHLQRDLAQSRAQLLGLSGARRAPPRPRGGSRCSASAPTIS